MANIKVVVDYELINGAPITFKAPCNASEVVGLTIYHPVNGIQTPTTFVLKDAHGNDLSSINELFASGAYVKVLLDTVNNYAFVQNADTNAYLENMFKSINDKVNLRAKIATGSYTGTGTSGESNKNRIVYPFVPDILIIQGSDGDTFGALTNQELILLHGILEHDGKLVIKWHSTHMTFYSTNNSGQFYQYNVKDVTYTWVAIGLGLE